MKIGRVFLHVNGFHEYRNCLFVVVEACGIAHCSLLSQDDLDSGYHTADGSLRDEARGYRSIEARPAKPPGEYTLTRQELRRSIEDFNNNNYGLIMSLVRLLLVFLHVLQCTTMYYNASTVFVGC